jgi:hypothetical protein
MKSDEGKDMANRWVAHLMEAVSGCWEWHAPALHLGFRCRKPEDKDDCWEVWVYPAVQELLGGKHDGETGWSGFHFDVSGFLAGFAAESIGVSTRMEHDPPELVFEGRFRGKEVVLHVCLEPPEGVGATEVIDLTRPGSLRIREKD